MGWIPQTRMSSYNYILSYQAFKTDATRVPKRTILIHRGRLLGMSVRRLGSLSRVAGRERVR
jgi:hypothetical protein